MTELEELKKINEKLNILISVNNNMIKQLPEIEQIDLKTKLEK